MCYFNGYETWSPAEREGHIWMVSENRVLGRIFGYKRVELKGGWKNLRNEELNTYLSPKYYYGDLMKKMGGVCNIHGKGEK
jgi:hypothetical protein